MKSVTRILCALMLAGMLGIVCVRGVGSMGAGSALGGNPQGAADQHSISGMASQIAAAPDAAVQNILAMAAGKIPALGLSAFGNFMSNQSVEIAGKTYTNALSTNAKVSLLGVGGNVNITVNPDMQDAAIKIAGQLDPIVIVGTSVLSITACCQKPGGPEINFEYAKNNPAAVQFILNSAVKIPLLDIYSDSIFKYADGVLSSHTEKHSIWLDASLDISIGLPNPLVSATGVSFSLFGKFGQLLREKLIPQLRTLGQEKIQQAQAAISAENNRIQADINNLQAQLNTAQSQCNPPRVDTSSAGGFFSSLGRTVQTVASNPAACGQVAWLNTQLVAKRDIYQRGLLKAGTGIVWTGGQASSAGLTALDVVAQTLSLDEASGSWTIDDMKNVRAPKLGRLKVTFTIPSVGSRSIELTNLQFDFKNPVGSAGEIALAIAKQLIGLIPIPGL